MHSKTLWQKGILYTIVAYDAYRFIVKIYEKTVLNVYGHLPQRLYPYENGIYRYKMLTLLSNNSYQGSVITVLRQESNITYSKSVIERTRNTRQNDE